MSHLLRGAERRDWLAVKRPQLQALVALFVLYVVLLEYKHKTNKDLKQLVVGC